MTPISKAALAAAFAALVLATGAQARGDGPSFSCRGDLRLAERIICYDPELSRLDREVSALYRDAGGADGATPEIHAYIKDGMLRRNECSSARCIRHVLEQEIEYLQNRRDGGRY